MPHHDLAVVDLPPDQLKPYVGNQRIHPRRQHAQLEASIRAHGFTTPVLVDEDGVLISGHLRTLVARAMSLPTIPVIRLEGLSERQKKALRISENKIAANAEWDMDLLRNELETLSAPDFDFDPAAAGFEVAEVDKILSAPAPAELEAVPPAPLTPAVRPGDIWRCGVHRVGCGDARDRDFIAEVVGAGQVDAAFIDPPYNQKVGGHCVKKGSHREFAMAAGEMDAAAFITFLTELLGAAASLTKPGGVHFVCMDHHHMAEMTMAGERVYGRRLNLCVWNKSNPGMGSLYRSKHELVFVYAVGDAPHFNAVELGRHGRSRTNVWDYASVNALRGGRRHDLELHPTVKPIQLVADAICDVTRRDERVIDACLGSGTTLLACERVGRRCVGVELDPAYVEIALVRWRDLTGREPTLEATGQTLAQVREARLSAAA